MLVGEVQMPMRVDIVIGANVSEDSRGNVGAIPQIPRSRLREILQHAEGECIRHKCMFYVLYRWWSLRYVLGNMLPTS